MSFSFKPSTAPAGVQAVDLAIPTAEDAPAEIPPLRSLPGRRAGMTVYANGEIEYREGTPSAAPTLPTAPASTGPVVFMKEGTNQRIPSRMAQMADLVDLGGAIGVTSVGSALQQRVARRERGRRL
jgi:hypothetical protein